MSARYVGAASLIRDGASCVFNYTDILAQLMHTFSSGELIRRMLDENDGSRAVQPKKTVSAPKKTQKDPVEKSEEQTDFPKTSAPAEERITDLAPNDEAVLKLISERPSSLDDLVERSDLGFSAISEALTSLELSGHISREMDGVYSVSGG